MNAGADERERFNFTMFLSVAVHGILIFGISFGAVQSTSEVPTLEITLAAHHSEIAPNRADFLDFYIPPRWPSIATRHAQPT